MQAVQLVVIYDGSQVRVEGPINNKVLCYGLLEAARDAIKDFNDDSQDQAKSPLQVVKGMPKL